MRLPSQAERDARREALFRERAGKIDQRYAHDAGFDDPLEFARVLANVAEKQEYEQQVARWNAFQKANTGLTNNSAGDGLDPAPAPDVEKEAENKKRKAGALAKPKGTSALSIRLNLGSLNSGGGGTVGLSIPR